MSSDLRESTAADGTRAEASTSDAVADPNAAIANSAGQRPLRAVVVGAGGMGKWWARVIASSPVTELVGVADLVEGMPAQSIAQSGVEDPSAVAVGTDGVDLALEVGADILIDPTVPVAHHPVTRKALHAGIPVLGEKPVTETLPEALSLMAHSELTGVPFMVSQSRRFFPQVRELRRFVAEHGPTILTSAFFSLFTEHEGFRATQQHPLLRDMGIHAFDTARYITGTDPLAVTAHGTNPQWSVYAGDATVSCTFEMSGGSLFVYNGTWNARGLPTYWNSEWRIGAEQGTATWDGKGAPQLGTEDEERTHSLQTALEQALAEPEPDQIDASIIEFVTALREGRTPMCEVHENILSFAMVEAAVASVDRGTRVVIDELLEEARTEAIAAEDDPEARDILQSWPSVREAIARG
ncbi:Gfo/Idh/MocA family protein [Brachybacterium kimchii]|uniref:Gfo/Idh/MocA family oxidoreductase n=1 Tax=Brachybacterium kimchii TaxID=2942909 RepID=A0ABY4N5Y0_9MICO|nr:Gfo/Idh/MocA family oxidoreductase [Brachybacterium kimchii]UQN29544.1 Gfo/Idh/MocA family oxidoreductase [Brachybacterium kimchii]